MKGVVQAYAMTEASHQMTSNPLPKNGPHKAGTVGRAQGSVQVTILDEQNKQLPVGKVGEICIRGPNVTKGYLNNPKANEEAYAGESTALCHPVLSMVYSLTVGIVGELDFMNSVHIYHSHRTQLIARRLQVIFTVLDSAQCKVAMSIV